MGPYYRQSSQGMGAIFETLYEHPILMVLFVAVTVGGCVFWYKKQKAKL